MPAPRDPDDYCPICGRRLSADPHRCSESDLEKIERGYASGGRRPGRHRRDDVDRLNEGLFLMESDPWGDDGFDPDLP